MNLFLRSHKVLTVHQEFVADGINSAWHFAVEFLVGQANEKSGSGDGRKRIDYRESLDPESFSLYARLRDWRKQVAEQEAVPLYTIFTNKQLACIAEERIQSKEGLRKIEGVGAARIDKYGAALIELVVTAHEKNDEAPEQPLSTDH
ncbi:MAG: HRDC domain-containing protein [Candidatus Electrothrix sp. GW3-4]|uniref:HRDC domain-containing protein n=1 Tax=Candidatus Electrothrix sp. GW3-4 TaxID=3126740 RepID=UPI0030D444CF